ncbi:hypothetical protein AAVH_32718 [Aphelenchoides avenae]|nr:hypothetical protein AAVH_32718 [Aphelenchus avenae]
MNFAKPKKSKDSRRQSSTSSEEDEAFTVPISLAEEEVNVVHDMVVSSLTKPKRPTAGNRQSQPQSSSQVPAYPALRQAQQRTATTTSAFPREEVLTELQERLAATQLEEKPQPSQSQPATRPPRLPYRSLRLSAGRRGLDRATLHTVPSDPTNEDEPAGRALDALADMVRADPMAWPTTAVCMALLCPQSRQRIMPRYGKQFWEDAAEAIYGPADQ